MKHILLAVLLATNSSICNAQLNALEGFLGYKWGTSYQQRWNIKREIQNDGI